jgi:AraC-like DNA-binding protein
MLADEAAQELARRLVDVGLEGFVAVRNTVSRPDPGFHITLTLVNAGRGTPYDVQRALQDANGLDAPVLFADSFSPGGLEILSRERANYLDRVRTHIHVPAPEMFVHMANDEEAVPFETEPARLRLDGSAGAIAIALLENPAAEYRVTALADALHVSPATVQRVFYGLEADALLIASGRGPQKVRRLADPTGAALLDRYATDARRDRRRVIRLRVLGDSTGDVVAAVTRGLSAASIGHALTGSAAAVLEAPAVTRAIVPVEFWVNGPTAPEAIAKAVEGIPSDEGANVILWRVGSRGPLTGTRVMGGITRASRFRVYADLLADPRRGKEQAAYYRESVIGF